MHVEGSADTPKQETSTTLSPSDHPQISSDDVIIAVMGITGCGKTTFVNHFSDQDLVIGHGLDSCTQFVQPVPCTLENGTKIFLVDTPGFDDSIRSDSEVLSEVALWLNEAHRVKVKLTGIILLHRISDPRVGGTGQRNIRMFKKLCGDQALGSVVLATTMWDYVPSEAIGRQRETELKEENMLWKPMIDQGSVIFRQDAGRASALTIIEYLIKKRRPVVLDIQREMVDENRILGQTTAGAELRSEILRGKEARDLKFQKIEAQLREALAKKDEEQKVVMEEAKNLLLERKQKEELDFVRLRANNDQLLEEMKIRYERELQEMQLRLEESHTEEKLKLQMRMRERYKMIASQNACIVM